MAAIISIVNQKGGVGKTTTATNLPVKLAEQGKRVLLIDLDPQANATSGLGIDHTSLEHGLYEAITGKKSFKDIIIPTNHEGYFIAPATLALAGTRVELIDVDRREYRLLDALLEVRNDYDVIFIDCPPSLDLLAVNGLVAADQILIPVQAEYYALEGLGQLLHTINLVKENLKPELEVLGAVLTMYDRRYRLSNDILHELYRYFPNKIFRSVIPRNVRLAEAPSHGKTIFEYDRRSKAAKAYDRLSREFLETAYKKQLINL